LEKAALSAFVEVGLGATTIEMITERADVGKGTFYQHFSTKEEVLAHLVNGAVERLLLRIQKAVQGVRDIRSTIAAIVQCHLDYFQTSREEFILFFQGHGAVNLVGTAPEELEASYLRYLEKLESIIRERLLAVPGDVPLRRMACAIAGFAVGYLSFAVLGLSEENLRETYRPVRETLVNGLTLLVERSLAVQTVSGGTAAPAPRPASEEAGSPPPTPPSTMSTTPP
jgi:AcrR family transcriptional regulator